MIDDEYVVIPTGYNADGDPIPHSAERPFCDDPTCPCREDQTLIGELAGYVNDGLATPADANNIYHNRQV